VGIFVQLTGAAWPAAVPACVCRLHLVAVRPAAVVSDKSALEACSWWCAVHIEKKPRWLCKMLRSNVSFTTSNSSCSSSTPLHYTCWHFTFLCFAHRNGTSSSNYFRSVVSSHANDRWFVLYQINCTPKKLPSRSTAPAVDYLLPPFVSKYTLTKLKPATHYLCLLQSSTRKGFGPYASLSVWTEPDGLCSIVCCWLYWC